MADADYGLLLPFDTDDPEFTRGVAIGMVWQMGCPSPAETVLVHSRSAEMLARMVDAGAALVIEDNGDEWLTVSRSVRETPEGNE